MPPNPRWDVTDFGLGGSAEFGLVLINLAEQPEYCEKLMYAKRHQMTPVHAHRRKKQDIICRFGRLAIELWSGHPKRTRQGKPFTLLRNGERTAIRSGTPLILHAGERVTIKPGIYHAFWPESTEAIIGEVSTTNDDARDNFFVDRRIGRFPEIEEDAKHIIRLLWERRK